MTSPSVIFVNRFYHPDHSATAQMLTDVATGLAARGWDVQVISSRMGYEDPSARYPGQETHAGVDIRRVKTTRFGRAFLPGRLIDYLSFYVTGFLSLLSHARRGSVVVIKTDPPLLSVVLGPAARLRGARVVNWLQDIFPETAAELGVSAARSPLGRVLKFFRNLSVRSADMNIVIGPAMARRVAAMGVKPDRIRILENFCDDEAIFPVPPEANPLRAQWGLAPHQFVVGYSGNLGRAHDLETFLGAAERLKDDPRICFLFIGGGHLRRQLDAEAQKRGLSSVVTRPYQDRDQLHLSLSAADVHWISLRPQLEGLILPSKLYGVLAAGRPVIMVGDRRGDIARWVREGDFGYAVGAGDVEGFATAILDLANAPCVHARQAAAARAFLEAGRRRADVIAAWSQMLTAL